MADDSSFLEGSSVAPGRLQRALALLEPSRGLVRPASPEPHTWASTPRREDQQAWGSFYRGCMAALVELDGPLTELPALALNPAAHSYAEQVVADSRRDRVRLRSESEKWERRARLGDHRWRGSATPDRVLFEALDRAVHVLLDLVHPDQGVPHPPFSLVVPSGSPMYVALRDGPLAGGSQSFTTGLFAQTHRVYLWPEQLTPLLSDWRELPDGRGQAGWARLHDHLALLLMTRQAWVGWLAWYGYD